MSEGSRGVQAPSRPDDATELDRGAEPGHAAGSDEDFYTTVNNAAASRSTRVRPADGDQDRSGSADGGREPDYARAAMPWDTGADDAARTDGPAAGADGADQADRDGGLVHTDRQGAGEASDELSDGSADRASSEGAGQPVKEGKSWRDRWNDLTGSVLPKRAEPGTAAPSAPPVADASSSAEAVAVEADAVSPVAPVDAPPAVVAVPIETAAAAPAGEGALAARGGESLAPRTKPKLGAPHRTRKARLRLSRIDPWSVMKTSFLFSIAAGIVLVVAVYVIWTVIGSSGLFSSVNDIVSSVVSTPGDTTPFRIEEYVNTQKVMGVTAFVACIDVVIFTALATLVSFLYNLASTMLGGLEVTLAED